MWMDGALARLEPEETLDKLIHSGVSTSSLGYVGLFETVMALTGKPHTDPSNIELSERILQFLNDKCSQWKAAENIDYSLYGTPKN